ncbi:MAG TPA: hypothetical protein VIH31_02520 [Candidatus Paceibacterota bacterium]
MIFLGIADIFSAGLLGLKILSVNLPIFLLIIFSGYLIVKNLIFGLYWVSIIDLLAAGLMILSIFFILPEQYYLVIAGVLGIKGFQSIFASLI